MRCVALTAYRLKERIREPEVMDAPGLEEFLKKLTNYKLIRLRANNSYRASFLGQSIAKSFLTVEKSLEIIDLLRNKNRKIIDIVLELKALRNVYLTKKVVADLSKHRAAKYASNNFFSASVLSLMDANYVKKRKTKIRFHPH